MKLLLISAILHIAVDAHAECIYEANGRVQNAPCMESRITVNTNPEQWQSLRSRLSIVSYSTVSETRRICDGAKACKVDGSYHTTHGDIMALVRLAR